MFTAYKTELGRLKALRDELDRMYREALVRRDFARAGELYPRLLRARRAVLTYGEWHVVHSAQPDRSQFLATGTYR